MFTLKEIIRNKDKRKEFIEKVKDRYFLTKEESKLLYYSHKINDIENFLKFIGKYFYLLVDGNVLEERIPYQEELPEMKYLKYLNCKHTNIKEIPYLPNLKQLDCEYTNIEKIPQLENLEKLDCSYTNVKEIPYLENLEKLEKIDYFCVRIKEIPYMPKLKEVYPKDIKMRNK